MSGVLVAAPVDRTALVALLERHVAELDRKPDAVRLRRHGLCRLLDRLENAEGDTWQARWHAAGEAIPDWQAAAGAKTPRDRRELMGALETLMCYRVIRPSYRWLTQQRFQHLHYEMWHTTDRDDFERLRAGATQLGAPGGTMSHVLALLTPILIHTGKRLAQLTTADLLEYAATVRARGRRVSGLHTAHQLLRHLGVLHDPPLTIGFTRRRGQYSVEELVDRQGITCQTVRELLVRYLRERAAALDYASLSQLAGRLVKLFWGDLERHHPGIDSLRLPPEVAEAWKARAHRLPDGRPRRDLQSLLLAVRGFYLDLAHWAVERPEVWAPYVYASPVSEADLRPFRKEKHRRQARMHARIRALMPALPSLVGAVRHRHRAARGLLDAARTCPEGAPFVYAGQRYERLVTHAGKNCRELGAVPVRVRPLGEGVASILNAHTEEGDAFWARGIVEVLRLTGIRLEELLELTHLSVREYRMPDGERVLLLQIAPSKLDQERVLPICPELAHVLAAIVARVRGPLPCVPMLARYDPHERVMSAPLPYLFQRRRGGHRALISGNGAKDILIRAAALAGLRDVDDQPLRFTPHDFRRLFATDAVNGGLPIHIAAKLLGHLDLNTTRGYVAIYPEQVVRHYQAHLARRRAARPPEEYRAPTEDEWAEFAKHFRRRRMALGDCYRPYGTACPHEHACVRCPMLRMDPAQLPRLLQIEQNTLELLTEARECGWDGERAGLEETLVHIAEKKAQVERIRALPDRTVSGDTSSAERDTAEPMEVIGATHV
ncbi:MAG: tyrosine-type recombinase/integrase [Candidatus Methylomirabilia bacterium]